MGKNKNKAIYQKIVQDGFRLLENQFAYSQTDIIYKIAFLGVDISKSLFSNILSAKREIGNKKLHLASECIQKIVKSELGYDFDENTKTFSISNRPDNWTPKLIPLNHYPSEKKESLIIHENGRLPIQEKVNFLKSAQKEVVEFGVRLRAFAHYFLSRSTHEFRNHIEELLAKGVNFNLYLLDPDSNVARLYFEDRSRILKEENKSVEVIPEVISLLKQINEELSEKNHPGKLRLFKYKHIPYCHFLIVDGSAYFGKMMVSPYLYGVRRADCPVIQLSKSSNRDMYRLYWTSYLKLIENAKPISL